MDPKEIAELGTRIYAEKFQRDLEATHSGQFVAIDIELQVFAVAPSPEEAVREAQRKNPKGVFHLIRIGSPGVYRVSYSSSGAVGADWVFGR